MALNHASIREAQDQRILVKLDQVFFDIGILLGFGGIIIAAPTLHDLLFNSSSIESSARFALAALILLVMCLAFLELSRVIKTATKVK